VNDPKNVKPIDRVKQYDSDYFQVSAKKLFCSACREEVSTKKSITDNHINSVKHQKGKERLTSKKKGEQSIVEALKRYDTSEHRKGETLPDSVRILPCEGTHIPFEIRHSFEQGRQFARTIRREWILFEQQYPSPSNGAFCPS